MERRDYAGVQNSNQDQTCNEILTRRMLTNNFHDEGVNNIV